MPKRAKRLLLCGAVLAACTLIRPAVHLINQLRAQNVSVYTRIHATRHDARHMHGTDLHSQDGQLVPSHLNETRRFPQRLSRSFVHAHASSSGVIAVTWANNALIDFARNWIIRLRNVGVHSYIVGALDKQLYSALAAVNEPVFALYSEIHEPHSRQIGWGTPAFHAMGQQKVDLIQRIAAMNVTALISDADVAFMRDPFPFLQQFPEADLLVSSDSLHHTKGTASAEPLEDFRRAFSALNIGLMLVKPSAHAFLNNWQQQLLSQKGRTWDQAMFNRIIRAGVSRRSSLSGDQKRLVTSRGLNFTIKFGVLPISRFCSGHTYFVQRMPQKLGVSPIAAHTTFQFSGIPGKRHRMREAMLFDADDLEHFQPVNGLVSYDNHVPEHMLQARQTVQQHFDIVNVQLRRLRFAIAISIALNRTLILPRFTCGHDRFWAPHTGKIPGSELDLPFSPCPADHLLDIAFLERRKHSRYSGVTSRIPFDYREYSLLQNPKTPPSVLSSMAHVGVLRNSTANKASATLLPSHLTDTQLREHTKSLQSIQLLHFDDVESTFSRFEDPSVQQAFTALLKHATAIYCCIPGKKPGHVFYDFLWDMSHTDQDTR